MSIKSPLLSTFIIWFIVGLISLAWILVIFQQTERPLPANTFSWIHGAELDFKGAALAITNNNRMTPCSLNSSSLGYSFPYSPDPAHWDLVIVHNLGQIHTGSYAGQHIITITSQKSDTNLFCGSHKLLIDHQTLYRLEESSMHPKAPDNR
jgi:hypothetical protein